MISSWVINKADGKDEGANFSDAYSNHYHMEGNGEVPHQQIFEINEHQKYRFLSETSKKMVAKPSEIMGFSRQQGRRSVTKNVRTSHKDRSGGILPSKIRGNQDYTREDNDSTKKESNSLSENKYDHPMIINQMHDPKTFSRLSDSYCTDILTPKSAIREIKPLKTTKSFNSHSKMKQEDLDVNLAKVWYKEEGAKGEKVNYFIKIAFLPYEVPDTETEGEIGEIDWFFYFE